MPKRVAILIQTWEKFRTAVQGAAARDVSNQYRSQISFRVFMGAGANIPEGSMPMRQRGWSGGGAPALLTKNFGAKDQAEPDFRPRGLRQTIIWAGQMEWPMVIGPD